MKLTVGELRKGLDKMPDDAPVFIERIEDIYFQKYNWTSEQVIFRKDEKGVPIDETEIIRASSAGVNLKNPRLIIYAHI